LYLAAKTVEEDNVRQPAFELLLYLHSFVCSILTNHEMRFC